MEAALNIPLVPSIESDSDDEPGFRQDFNQLNRQHNDAEEDEDQMPGTPAPPDRIVISGYQDDNCITVEKVIHVEDLPEYPQTSEGGVAYIVNTRHMTPEHRAIVLESVQYCRKKAFPNKHIRCKFLNNATCERRAWNCTGMKFCQYLDPRLIRMEHGIATEDMLQEICSFRYRRSVFSRRRQAHSYYRAVMKQFATGAACQALTSPTCVPQFIKDNVPTVAGVYSLSISCVHANRGNTHFWTTLKSEFYDEEEFFTALFACDIPQDDESCYVVEQTTTRRTTCGVDHPQGQGLLRKHQTCKVRLGMYVPEDFNTCPYIIWTSHGIHDHPPPIPSRPIPVLVDGLIAVIKRINDPSLTTASLLRNPYLREFVQSHGQQSLSSIHQTFVNTDRIAFILKKQQLLLYPEGQSVASLRYEYEINQRNLDDPYIQEVYTDHHQTMVICFLKEAANVLWTLHSIEVDMSFKRIRDGGFNEVVFAAFMPHSGKTMTFVRVYVNTETTAMYELLFRKVFNLIQNVTGKPVRWQHIHQLGIRCLVMDMDGKQLKGFAQYLQSLEPEESRHRWQWHAKHAIIYCEIHFKRGIIRAAGTSEASKPVQRVMAQLLHAQSADEYDKLCDLIRDNNEFCPAVRAWARHKKIPLYAAGTNRYHSLMPLNEFVEARRHTNAVESSHHKAQALGIHLSLLKAVKNGEQVDRRDVHMFISKSSWGINLSWRLTGMEARFNNEFRRDFSRKRRRTTHSEEALDELDEQDFLDLGSSSGYVSPVRAQRRGQSRSRSASRSRTQSSTPAASRNSQRLPSESLRRSVSIAEHNRSSPVREQANRNIEAERFITLQNENRRLELQNKAVELEQRKQELEIRRQEMALVREERELGIM